MLNVWIKETMTSLKHNNGYMLSSKFNHNSYIYIYLNLIKLLYSWRWKLAVIDFLKEIGSPLIAISLPFWLVQMIVVLRFQIVDSSFDIIGKLFISKDLQNKFWLSVLTKWFTVRIQFFSRNYRFTFFYKRFTIIFQNHHFNNPL